MKVVAVTRTRDEDDLLEAFVRHHARLVDAHVFIDNASTDGTGKVLGALKGQGFPVEAFDNASLIFHEIGHNTQLLHLAARRHQADWVLFLDTDEFLDTRAIGHDLRGWLATMPNAVQAFTVPVVNYHDTVADDVTERNPVLRMRWRSSGPPPTEKVFMRGRLTYENVSVAAGNHGVLVNDTAVLAPLFPNLPLAHFSRRAGPQAALKNVLGRLRVIAAGQGEVARGSAVHYSDVFAVLRRDAAQLLRGDWMKPRSTEGLVEDPLPYLGGALNCTPTTDYAMKAISCLVAYAEQLAAQHGRILDTNAGVRLQVEAEANRYRLKPLAP
jgi:hypothetical protein